MPLVEMHHVGFTIGATPILTGIDLVVTEGETLGIAGPNGAGKTTLLMILATLLAPSSGGGTILGAGLGSPEVYGVRSGIGLSAHDPAIYDELSLLENLTHVARLAHIDPDVAASVLRQVGLEAARDRRAAHASEGMRRRVDLARLLMISPRLVLLDEAHSGLDDDARVIVAEISRRTALQGGAVVMVSHDADGLVRQTDRIVRLTPQGLA